MVSFTKIEVPRQRLADLVYQQILQALHNGELSTADSLHQERLAELLHVSRTPVREALLRLEQDGILDSASNGGFKLRKITAGSVRNIYDTRLAIEGFCAKYHAENRGRVINRIIDGIRERCASSFILGLRLSPERFEVKLADIIEFAQTVLDDGKIDFLDMSLWDIFKEPEEEAYKGRSLMSYFTELNRGNVALGVAGKLRTPEEIQLAMASDIDFVLLGRAAILHHDYPLQMQANDNFVPVSNPVSADHLRAEGLGEAFVSYMSGWDGFVE